jgi:hypothetical protein
MSMNSEPNPYAPPTDERLREPEAPVGAALEVRFDLTVEDVIDFQVEHLRRHSAAALWMLRIVGGLLVVACVVPLVYGELSAPALAGGLLLLTFGLWFGSRMQIARAVHQAVASGRRITDLGSWSLRVAAGGVTFSSPNMRCEYRWPALERIVDSGAHLFLYTSSITALIVPKRAFASAEQTAAFSGAAARYLREDRASRGLPLEAPPVTSTRRVLVLWLCLVLLIAGLYLL